MSVTTDPFDLDDDVDDEPLCDGRGCIPHPTRGCTDFHDGPHYWCFPCDGCPACEPTPDAA